MKSNETDRIGSSPVQGGSPDHLASVIRYHQETKHHFFRYARALGYMDWANQPDPFRRFAGVPLVQLPLLGPDEEPSSPLYAELYDPQRCPSQPVSVRSLSRFLEFALALSAWKQVGDVRWSLRSNPSSGNLHPTEGYLLIGPVEGLSSAPSLFHYAPKEHALERRARYGSAFGTLMELFPPGAFLFGLTSIHWREAWKYGERAFRYCQHDAGHAIAAARYAAATMGWQLVVLGGVSDTQLQGLLGTGRAEDFVGAEEEHPDCVAVVWPEAAQRSMCHGASPSLPLFLADGVIEEMKDAIWEGKANRLSRENPVPWEIIEEVAATSWKANEDQRILEGQDRPISVETTPKAPGELAAMYPGEPRAGQIIRQRRSAVAFDGETSISAVSFFTMMDRVMPRVELPVRARPVPWDAVSWSPRIHLAVFVHRVRGLAPGLYFLARDLKKLDLLRGAIQGDFLWKPPERCPADLPLFLLQEGDARRVAIQVSCHQDIAGDSAFALGMIAEFESSLREEGPWFYRRLFWESGIVGQVLYLEAEAAGVRATGIGCFFDDPMHQLLGLKDLSLQSLYHFTTGGAVEDRRLTTHPPYGHLQPRGVRP